MAADERAELARLHRECGKLMKVGDPDAYYAKNREFREPIYAGSHNGCLEETTRVATARRSPSMRRRFALSSGAGTPCRATDAPARDESG